jgi:TolA-binding protein
MAELNIRKTYADSIHFFEARIEQITKVALETDEISRQKNSWFTILNKIGDFSTKNTLIWIDDLRNQNANIILKGKSYRGSGSSGRDKITNLSKLFESSKIVRIDEHKIADHDVWSFEISFPRPSLPSAAQASIPEHLKNYQDYFNFRENIVPNNGDINIPESEKKQPDKNVNQSDPQIIKENETEPPRTPQTPPQSPPQQQTNVSNSKNLYNEILLLIGERKISESIKSIEKYFSNYPNGAEIVLVRYKYGEVLFNQRDYTRALQQFNAIYQLKKERMPEATYYLAETYNAMNDKNSAIRYYEIFVRSYPSSHPFYKRSNEQLMILQGGNQ